MNSIGASEIEPISHGELRCSIEKLPSLPAVLMAAIEHLNSGASLNVLADLIGRDPSMSARILRIANSPFFGMSREIGSLREAVVLLGLNRVRDLLLATCFPNTVPVTNRDFDQRSFWMHSMAVGACTRQLADLTDSDRDCAFVSGLLHDVGRLVAAYLFPDRFSAVLNECRSGCGMLAAEQRLFGRNHAEIGASVVEQWNFPIAIKEAIERHHSVPGPESSSLPMLIYLADNLVVRFRKTLSYRQSG